MRIGLPDRGQSLPHVLLAHGLGAGLSITALAYRLLAPQDERIRELAWVWVGASFLYLTAAALALWRRSFPLSAVVVWGVVMRALSCGTLPGLSTDHHRYLWDGKVQNLGINPYRYPPSAEELKPHRDDNWKGINHRAIPTIYPPASQLVFRAAVAGGGETALRFVFLLFEGLAWAAILHCLRRRAEPPGFLVFFAWCPLVVVEVAFNLHQDILGAALLLLACVGVGSGGALALSVMAKGYALVAVPLFLRHGKLRLATTFLLSAAVVFMPYAVAGAGMVGGLREYLGRWRANASLHPILTRLLDPLSSAPEHLASGALGLGLLVVVGYSAVRARRWTQVPEHCGLLMAAVILTSPIVFPWYLLCVAAFLPFTRSLPWTVFTCSILTAYTWFLHHEPLPHVMWMEYGPLVLVWGVVRAQQLIRLRRRAPQRAGGEVAASAGDQLP